MSQAAALSRPALSVTRMVGLAGGTYLIAYVLVSIATGQQNVWVGDLAQLPPPLAYAALTAMLARASTGQVRVFWNLNAIHGVLWSVGQVVWTYYDVTAGGIPTNSPTDPIFFLSSVPLAAALYGRPERDRPRWLFEIILLDIVLIALFAGFVYAYFIVSLAFTDGTEDVYDTNLTQLFNVRNFLIAGWAGWVWFTATASAWRRVLGWYAFGLALTFVGGVVYDYASLYGNYEVGSVWDIVWMVPYVVLSLAAARAMDDRLFAPTEQAPPLAKLPVVSTIAILMLVLIPVTDEIARRVFDVPAATQDLRTRLALAIMIPFGVVVVVRELLSRRALLRAGQELVATREQLAQKEKLAAVGQLVSGVAHELNNPLQGVLGYAELMAAGQPQEEQSEELRAIRENANRAAGIVRNLLTFAGRESAGRSWQDINAVVTSAAAKRAHSLQLSGTRLRVRLAERLPLAYVDATSLERVFTNLIENAEEAIGSQKTKVPGEIVIATSRDAVNDRIVIEVSDNGPGISTEDLPKLFDPFFTTRENGEGPGLGLSVCYGIASEHGGTIRAANRDTGGATVIVELPVTSSMLEAAGGNDAPPRQPRGELPDSPPTLSSIAVDSTQIRRPSFSSPAAQDDDLEPVVRARAPRALVVDDEDSNAALVRRALTQAGYEVESTTLSRRALIMLERSPYDVVVADVRMPELSGPELYTRCCQIRPEMARRFIFITGDIDGDETLTFLEQSGCGYFMKPFNLERLTAAVDALVANVRAPRA